VKARFNLGPVRITGFAAKVDPIKYVSNANGDMTDQGVYGLYAGAGRSPYALNNTVIGNGANAQIIGGLRAVNGVTRRPFASPINPGQNGAMSVEQLGGARAELSFNRIGTLGATYIALSGKSSAAPQNLANQVGLNLETLDDLSFNRVFVYSADVSTNILFGIGITGVYSKTDTGGERLNSNGSISTKTESKITDDNFAYDVAASKSFGALGLKAGYRYVSPFFAAPGYWTRVGSYYNPVDIKGPYGDVSVKLGKRVALVGAGQWYEGTDKATARGGLSKDDKIRNYRAGLNFSTTTLSRVDLGWEQTEYEILPTFGSSRVKPREIWWNLGYGYSFNPNNSIRFGYQYIDYDDKESGFDPNVSKGGVGTVEFRVKF